MAVSKKIVVKDEKTLSVEDLEVIPDGLILKRAGQIRAAMRTEFKGGAKFVLKKCGVCHRKVSARLLRLSCPHIPAENSARKS